MKKSFLDGLNEFLGEFFNDPDFDIVVFTFDIIIIVTVIGGIAILWKLFH